MQFMSLDDWPVGGAWKSSTRTQSWGSNWESRSKTVREIPSVSSLLWKVTPWLPCHITPDGLTTTCNIERKFFKIFFFQKNISSIHRLKNIFFFKNEIKGKLTLSHSSLKLARKQTTSSTTKFSTPTFWFSLCTLMDAPSGASYS